MHRYTWVLPCIWTVALATAMIINLVSIRKEFSNLARFEATTSFNKDVAYRRWGAMHGGVYAPVTEKTPSNPYLIHIPERDISTPSGRTLTLINPAYMTRQVHELGFEQYGLRGHITSLKPIRPENAPDLWETEALRAMEQGKKEITEVDTIDQKAYFRLMRPFMVEESCLKCHADQGYKVGDIRGGISISVPFAPYQAAARSQTLMILTGFTVVWALGLLGILIGFAQLKTQIRKRDEAKEKIKILQGLLPICASCKKIRDDKGYWNQIESYIHDHSEAEFSHGICPECIKKLYPEFVK